MEELHIDNAGCTIHYWFRKGMGNEYLFFLHGAAADHHMFDLQLPIIPKQYNIIVWDARAHGKSTMATSTPFEYRHMIDDVLAICKKQAITSAVFIGQSMGGNVCQDVAYYHPEKVKALILIDCTRNTNTLTRLEKGALRIAPILFKPYPTRILIKQSAKMCGNTEYTRYYITQTMKRIGKKRFVQIMKSLTHALHPDENYTFHCPTLLLCGTDDKTGNIKKVMSQWCSLDPACTLIWIHNAGHCANQDKPSDVNTAITQFLEGLQ